MSRHNASAVIRILCVLVLSTTSVASLSAADVTLHLQDGRMVTGTIDRRTNHQRLWLHAAEPSILLLSSFAWDDIVSARFDGRDMPAGELRPLAIKAGVAIDPERLNPRPPQLQLDPPATHVERGPLPPPLRAADFRVASLHIHAQAANWDNDPEDDGLLVTIYPLTKDGMMRPVDGQLNLKLFGRFTRPALNRRHFPELNRHSVRVRATDFGPDGAVYKFPFRNFHPDKNLDIDIFGLLTGRLVVAGHGTFDASDANVRLRQLSRFRDRLQLQSGQRYLPAENRRVNP